MATPGADSSAVTMAGSAGAARLSAASPAIIRGPKSLGRQRIRAGASDWREVRDMCIDRVATEPAGMAADGRPNPIVVVGGCQRKRRRGPTGPATTGSAEGCVGGGPEPWAPIRPGTDGPFRRVRPTCRLARCGPTCEDRSAEPGTSFRIVRTLWPGRAPHPPAQSHGLPVSSPAVSPLPRPEPVRRRNGSGFGPGGQRGSRDPGRDAWPAGLPARRHG